MFLAVCDVLVKVRALEVVSLEELREDTRVRVDHVDVGVAFVRESLSDVAIEPLYGRRAPLGIQSSPALLWIEGEVDLVRVSIMLLQTLTKSLELRELPGVQAFRFDDAVEIFSVYDFATRVRVHYTYCMFLFFKHLFREIVKAFFSRTPPFLGYGDD
jgi:hypothetical protein